METVLVTKEEWLAEKENPSQCPGGHTAADPQGRAHCAAQL